jgi:hypothetical protein
MELNDAKTFRVLKRAVERQGEALDVECDHCGAPPGKPCMSPSFRLTKKAHARRVRLHKYGRP